MWWTWIRLLGLLAACRVQSALCAQPANFYMITLPKALVLGAQHRVLVEIDGLQGRNAVVRVVSIPLGDKAKVPMAQSAVVPGGRGNFSYRVPFADYRAPQLRLNVSARACLSADAACSRATAADLLRESAEVSVLPPLHRIFIETSKPVYRPGEEVRLRLLAVDLRSLAAAETAPGRRAPFELVLLESPERLRLAQWRNVGWRRALDGLRYALSRDPPPGLWRVVAYAGALFQEAFFSVRQFALPRLLVSVRPPASVYIGARRVRFSVCAQLASGRPLRAAQVSAQFCVRPRHRFPYYRERPCLDAAAEILAPARCAAMELDAAPLQLRNSSLPYWNAFAFVNASVTAPGGLAGRAADFGGRLDTSELRLQDRTRAWLLRDGLPLHGHVRALGADGQPRPGVRVLAAVNGAWTGAGPAWNYSAQLVSDTAGDIRFALPPVPATLVRPTLMLRPLVEAGEDQEAEDGELLRPYRHVLVLWLRRVFSPTGTSLQVAPLAAQEPCAAARLRLRLESNRPLAPRALRVVLTARLALVHAWSLPPAGGGEEPCGRWGGVFSREVTLDGLPAADLFPDARLAVWFLHAGANGSEVVSAGAALPLPSCLAVGRPARLHLAPSPARPGDPVAASVSAPGARPLCGLSVADAGLDALAPGWSRGVTEEALTTAAREAHRQAAHWNPYGYRVQRRCAPDALLPELWHRPWWPLRPDASRAFRDADLLVLTSAALATAPCPGLLDRREPAVPEVEDEAGPRVRTFFPESWRFEAVAPGELALTAPDSVTEWRARLVCVSSAGLALAPEARLRVTQPFFLQLSPPPALVRGQSARVPVRVVGGAPGCLRVRLHAGPGPAALENAPGERCLCGFDELVAHLRLRPAAPGPLDVQVSARARPSDSCAGPPAAAGAADAVRRRMLVLPEGVERRRTAGDLLCPRGWAVEAFWWLGDVHGGTVVPGSARAALSWSGSVFGASLEHLDALVRLPFGCGEQNLATLVPSVYLLDFLAAAGPHAGGRARTEVRQRALRYLRLGYQRQLNFRRADGSFSAFGSRDAHGSTWLTAFALRSLAAAAGHVHVDAHVLAGARDFLARRAGPAGCFREDGRLLSGTLRGAGGADAAAVAAYVLAALVEARGRRPRLFAGEEVEAAAEGAVRCLRNATVPEDTPTPALALRAYALALWGPRLDVTRRLGAEMRRRARRRHGLRFWTAAPGPAPPADARGSAADVEATAYALLAELALMRAAGGAAEGLWRLMPGLRWLSLQRNDRGGWRSTQDTLMALQALTEVAAAAQLRGQPLDLGVEISVNGSAPERHSIDEDNRLLVSERALPLPAGVRVTVRGTGCAVVQTTLRYNEREDAPIGHTFSLNSSAAPAPGCGSSDVRLCVSYTGAGGRVSMAVMSLEAPPGWRAREGSRGHLEARPEVSRAEEDEQGVLTLYFEDLAAEPVCLEAAFVREVEVEPPGPLRVSVIDYYSPELRRERRQDLCGDR